MLKTKMIKAALLGSSSALGLNWIYDKRLLSDYSKNNDVLFIPIDHKLYKKAKTGFDVYPESSVGDLDFMGEIIYLFDNFISESENISLQEWRTEVYNYINDEGPYKAYVEKYGKELITRFEDELNNNLEPKLHTDYKDNQLIGLAIFTAIYENNKFKDKVNDSINYAKIFTSYEAINDFTKLLYNLFNDLKNGVD